LGAEGKREGFADKDVEVRRAELLKQDQDAQYEIHVQNKTVIRKDGASPEERRVAAQRVDAAVRERGRIYDELQKLPRSTTPSAPFVGKTEAWVSLALKRMIRWAAENGFDRVAWTTGEQQADRYDLSKHIGAILYQEKNDRGGSITAFDPKGSVAWCWSVITSLRKS
jgi:hypothetical protein